MTLTLRDLAFLGAGVPSVPWTPAQLGASLRIWLDADDASTISVSGSNVTQWRDKSGLSNHFSEGDSSRQFVRVTNQFNGKAALYKASAGGGRMSNTTVAFDGSGVSVAMVAQIVPALPPFNVVSLIGADGNNTARIIGSTRWAFPSGGGVVHNVPSMVFGTGPNADFNAGGIGTTPWTDYLGQMIATTTATGFTNGYFQGVLGLSRQHAWANWTAVPTTSLRVNNNSTGYLCEVIFAVNVLSQADREKLEGYLAHKWQGAGASNSLPSGHPFKATAPTV